MKPAPCIAERIQLDAALVPANVVQLRREEGLYFAPDKLASVLESPGRMARDVHGLLKVISALNSIRGLIGLERPLFELILDVIPAERAAIVLVEDTGGLLPGVLLWDKCNIQQRSTGRGRRSPTLGHGGSAYRLRSRAWIHLSGERQRRRSLRCGAPAHAGNYRGHCCNRAGERAPPASAR